MKSTELRIGNWVNDESGLHQVEVYDMSGFKLKPIPLTEEWLKKFGFKKTGKKDIKKFYGIGWLYTRSAYQIFIDFCDCAVSEETNDTAIFIEADIEYVHQLQNLYQALTNQELTIDEKTTIKA